MNVKKGPVVVMGNEEGKVISVNENNPAQGSIWLTQTSYTIDPVTNFVNRKTRNAWIKGAVNELTGLYTVGEKLPGNIVRLESLKPFSKDPQYADNDLKKAGDTGVVCKVDGQAIYSIARYLPDDTVTDQIIDHDNGEEIRAAQAAAKQAQEEPAVKPNADFSIGG